MTKSDRTTPEGVGLNVAEIAEPHNYLYLDYTPPTFGSSLQPESFFMLSLQHSAFNKSLNNRF